jgi:FkbM family methyltransferase
LVEPDPDEVQRLRATLRNESSESRVLPHALWRQEETITLYLTKSRGCSSVYRPNRAFLDQFPESDRFDIEREIPMQAVTVDSLVTSGVMATVDFAKIDVQGAELDILTGGRNHFASQLIGLEVEVEFCPMYEGQALFGHVETFVREALGLELWDIRKTYWKHKAGVPYGGTKGRLVFGDALFLRPIQGATHWLEALGTPAAQEKITMLAVAALAYGYADYVNAFLQDPEIQRFLDRPLRAALETTARSVDAGYRPLRHGSGRLYVALDSLARAVKPDHGGWATVGQSLGSRRRGPFWL